MAVYLFNIYVTGKVLKIKCQKLSGIVYYVYNAYIFYRMTNLK